MSVRLSGANTVIFTESSAVTMDRTAYSFDGANSGATSAWYFEYVHPFINALSEEGFGVQNLLQISADTKVYQGSATNWNLVAFRAAGTTASGVLPNTSGNTYLKEALIYDDAADLMSGQQQNQNDRVMSADTAMAGAPTSGATIDLFLADYTVPAKIRNLRRYDTDYSLSKQVIDRLMKLPLPVDTNLYVNSKLIGGDSPFSHTVGFGTAEFNSTRWVEDYFIWESNFPQDNGRAYLNYNVAANNPDLEVGKTYRFTYRVRSDNPLAQCISVSAVTNVTAVYGTRMPGTDWGEVTVDITIDAPGWACMVRCGTGTTAPSFQHVQVRNPTLMKL